MTWEIALKWPRRKYYVGHYHRSKQEPGVVVVPQREGIPASLEMLTCVACVVAPNKKAARKMWEAIHTQQEDGHWLEPTSQQREED